MASTVASQSLYQHIIGQLRSNMLLLTSYFLLLISLASCSSSKFISRQAQQTILADSNLTAAHVGISIYDASANKYLYNYQGDKYFIPASNTKIVTCYAAMKHLGDSLVGLRYLETPAEVEIHGTGDPTFLHPEFRENPVFDFLKTNHKPIKIILDNDDFKSLGFGWSWDDYLSDYMAERSFLPMYGNTVSFTLTKDSFTSFPSYFQRLSYYSRGSNYKGLNVTRNREENKYFLNLGKNTKVIVPFFTNNGADLQASLLQDTLKAQIVNWKIQGPKPENHSRLNNIYSQPTDSLLKPMMHRSDNFFAEQTLLMVSNEMTGVMNDAKIIDSLLKTDLKDLPQKPRWVDGSGLSRYNLFSPQDFVHILNKMKNEFEWNRITTILPTGGEGTLSNYYINLKDRIFAKTGTLSNNVALSGFLISKQNKTIIFSVLVNNHMGNTTQIRRSVEKFLTTIAERF